METVLVRLEWPLVIVGVILFLTLLGAIFKRDSILNRLESDSLGWMMIAVAVILIAVGVFIKDDAWVSTLLNLGGVLLGIGILIALPRRATETVVDWHNLGILIALAGFVVVWNYFLAPLGPAFVAAWDAFKEFLDPSQLYGLLGIVAIIAGLFINSLRFRVSRVNRVVNIQP